MFTPGWLGLGLVLASSGREAEPDRIEAEPVLVEAAPSASAPASGTASAAAAVEPPAPPCPVGFACDYAAFDQDPRPPITAVRVEKAAHRMFLISHDRVVRHYTVALGWGGAGHKQREGDGVTPIGEYRLTGKLPTSPWHILIGISYPNYEDVKRHARLKAEGVIPHDASIGFGIALHGRAASMKDGEHKQQDWTAGCVAVDNPEIEEIAAIAPKDTPITIVE